MAPATAWRIPGCANGPRGQYWTSATCSGLPVAMIRRRHTHGLTPLNPSTAGGTHNTGTVRDTVCSVCASTQLLCRPGKPRMRPARPNVDVRAHACLLRVLLVADCGRLGLARSRRATNGRSNKWHRRSLSRDILREARQVTPRTATSPHKLLAQHPHRSSPPSAPARKC